MTDKKSGNFLVDLRLLSGKTRKVEDVLNVILFVHDFLDNQIPDKFGKSFNIPFTIKGFNKGSFKLEKVEIVEDLLTLVEEAEEVFLNAKDEEFKKKAKKLLEEAQDKKSSFFNENNIVFISDLLGFVEQSAIQLNSFLNQDGKIALNQLGLDFFAKIGLQKETSEKVKIKEIKKLETDPNYWKRITEEITGSILEIIEKQFGEEIIQKQEDESEVKKTAGGLTIVGNKKKDNEKEEDEAQDGGGKTPDQIPPKKDKKDKKTQDSFSTEFNLARLDEKSKLYVRSLAIISVNQALQLQFANLSQEQLAQMGFASLPTFDQLPLETRQQLLSVAFSKIENNLAGKNLEELFNNPANRVILAKNSALDILSDIRGGQIFATSIGQLVDNKQSETQVQQQLKNNSAQNLTQTTIAQRLKIDPSQLPAELSQQISQLSLREANNFFKQLDANPELKQQFLRQSQHTFSTIDDRQFIESWKKLFDQNNQSTADSSVLFIEQNLFPTIDTFIQQNYPVSYLDHFDWQHFKTYFGDKVIDEQTFKKNPEAVKNLLAQYWRSRRSSWSQSVHRGINQEFYTSEQAEKLYQEMTRQVSESEAQTKAGKILLKRQNIYWSQQAQQTGFNRQDPTAVAQLIAGIKAEELNLANFDAKQQTDLLNFQQVYRQQFLDAINQHQIAQQATLYFYGLQQTQSQNIVLNSESLNFSPYDFGAINYNQLLGQGADDNYALQQIQSPEGTLSSQLQQGFSAAQSLYDDTIGKGVDFLAEKGIEAGLSYATGGAYAALPQPIKDIINKVAWGELKKRLEPILKIIGIVTAGSVGAIIALLAKNPFRGGAKIVQGAFGGKNTLEVGLQGLSPEEQAAVAENSYGQQLAAQSQEQALAAQQAQAQTAQAGVAAAEKGLLANLGSSAMATASQAVIAAFSLVAAGTLFYQVTINSAFLTQFPTNQYGGGGSAVFCNGVSVGNLTYYSQRIYSQFMIQDGACSFGSSACGPVTAAMFLNRDPLQMSIDEGFIGADGRAMKLSCAGSSMGDIRALLSDYGVETTPITLSGSSEQITNEIGNYLAEGNLILTLSHVRGYGHFNIITCVEGPGRVATYDAWWGENAVHNITERAQATVGSQNMYIREAYLVRR